MFALFMLVGILTGKGLTLFDGTYLDAIEALWLKLGLGRPQMQSDQTATMNADGVDLEFACTSDGQGILVSTVLGRLSKSEPLRGQQIEKILQTNLAVLSVYAVHASLNKQRSEDGELVLSVRCNGFSSQGKLIEMLEDLLAANSLYLPVFQETDLSLPLPGAGVVTTHLEEEASDMMVFSL